MLANELIVSELDKLCRSAVFSNSEQLRRIISYMVEETLAGKGQSIKAYNIAVEALGRRPDFDPSTDSIVRSEVHRLRAKLKKYYGGEGKNSLVTIDIPVNSYQPKFISAVKDWEKGQTPALLPTDGTLDAPGLLLKRSWRPSIIVLPFTNDTPGGEYEYFSRGLSEQLSIALSKFQDIEVLNIYARTEADQASVQEISDRLKNRFVLEGSYCVIEGNMRVRVRLSDMEKSSILWAETMDLKYISPNFFILEDKILQNILEHIAGDYGRISQYMLSESFLEDRSGLEIYEAILRYYSYTVKDMMSLHVEARDSLEQCLNNKRQCPALVYAALGDVCISDYKFGFDTMPDAIQRAERHINQALGMDYNLQGAHVAKTNLCSIQRDQAGLVEHLENVISINPNNYPAVAAGMTWYAMSGHWEDGCRRLEKLYHYDSMSIPYWYYLPFLMHSYKKGEYDEALHYVSLYKKNDSQGMGSYYSVIVNTKLGNKDQVQNEIGTIRGSEIGRRGKVDRMIRCLTFDDQLCDQFMAVLKDYDLD